MSKRNAQVTDQFDRDHRRIFVTLARETADVPSRQQARYHWQRRAKGRHLRRALENCWSGATMELTEGNAA